MFRLGLLAAPVLFTLLLPGSARSGTLCEGHAVCALREAAAHAGILFGFAADPTALAPGTAAADLAAREFSSLTPENDMKWGALSPAPGVYDFSRADALADFAAANGMRLRGHALHWGRINGPPSWIEDVVGSDPDPAARLRGLMADHTAAVAGRYAGRVETWDVVNEPLALFGPALDTDTLYGRVLGDHWVDEAFHLAAAADPGALLFLNETNVEAYPTKFQGLVALAGRLVADGVPIDGVGLQAHFLQARPDRARLEAQIRALADLGLLVELTELDIPLYLFAGEADPRAAQAAAYADVVRACVAVAACRGITVWGLSDADTWIDALFPFSLAKPTRPLLFDEGLAPKPAYDAVLAALLAVPEPSSAVLLATGALLLGRVCRRREETGYGACGSRALGTRAPHDADGAVEAGGPLQPGP